MSSNEYPYQVRLGEMVIESFKTYQEADTFRNQLLLTVVKVD